MLRGIGRGGADRTVRPGLRLLLSIAVAPALGLGASEVRAQPGLEDVGFVLGDTAAPVKIIEFGDFGCWECAAFWEDSWSRIRRDLIDTGRVAWWHVPVAVGYRHGEKAANGAQCAAEQDGYWRMHDLLLAGQEEWLSTRRPEAVFTRMAREAGLDAAAFSACYEERRWEERVEAANRVARRGITGLPTFFVNGRPVVGAVRYEVLLEFVVDAERDEGGGQR